MYGDQFGTRALRIELRANLRATIPTRPGSSPDLRRAYPLGLYTPLGGALIQDSRYAFEPQSAGAGELRAITGAELLALAGTGERNTNYQQTIPPPAPDQNATRDLLNDLLSIRELTLDQINRLPVDEATKAELRAIRAAVNGLITQTTRGVTFSNLTVGQISANFRDLNTPIENVE